MNNPPPSKPAVITIATSMARKSAYVRAAKPGKLTAWVLENLDRASGFKPGPPER